MAKHLSASKFAPWNWLRHENEKTSDLTPRRDIESPLMRMHEEMDRMFDDTMRSFGFPSLFERTGDREPLASLWRPQVDIKERDNHYLISVELPGVEEKDIKVSVEDDRLLISGEKRQEEESDEKGKFHRIERHYGSFQRMLSLPQDADTKDIHAAFDKGVLTVTVHRDRDKAVEHSRTIPIEKAS